MSRTLEQHQLLESYVRVQGCLALLTGNTAAYVQGDWSLDGTKMADEVMEGLVTSMFWWLTTNCPGGPP